MKEQLSINNYAILQNVSGETDIQRLRDALAFIAAENQRLANEIKVRFSRFSKPKQCF